MFELGLTSPICLTWELTYACNLACVHCLSSSGRRDPRELTTAECETVIDTLQRMQVFYVNIGGGEPTVRPDFWELLDYSTAHQVGVKFSTNGIKLDAAAARRLAASDYIDVQISLDGATADVNDAVRGTGSYETATRAMAHLAAAGFRGFKVSVVVTRHNVSQLDAFKQIADDHGAQLRLTRLRPSGRGADVWPELHPTATQQRELYDWLAAHGEQVLTGDSFFHLSPYGKPLPGLNMCGAGRVVCLIDPVGDVYACPFAIHENFLAGNVRHPGGFETVWRESPLFAGLRQPQTGGACSSCGSFDSCRGGCMAAKFFTGLPLDGPDPECVRGHGEAALALIQPGGAGHASPCGRPFAPPGARDDRPPPAAAGLRREPAGRVRGRLGWPGMPVAAGPAGALGPGPEDELAPAGLGLRPIRARACSPGDGTGRRFTGPGVAAHPGWRPSRGRLVVRDAGTGQPEGPGAGSPSARRRHRASRAERQRMGPPGPHGGDPGPRPRGRARPLPGRAGTGTAGDRGR